MGDENDSVVEKLLRRMDAGPGFAGLGASVQTISSLSDDDDGGTREMTATILQDAALTSKLLRLANSSARAGRNVSTVDQAIIILGINTVKSVALSLALLDTLSNKPQSKQLHAEIVAAYFCGTLAYEITRCNAPRYNAQEAQVCGLMQNLGRMMAIYYLYEDIERSHALQVEKNIAEDEAVKETFGVSYDDIGAAIASHWNLPDVIRQSFAPQVGKAPPRAVGNAMGWHQMCTLFARRVTDALFREPEPGEKNTINQNIVFFKQALLLKDDEAREWIDRASESTEELLSGIAFPCDVEQAKSLLRKGSERVTSMLSAQDSLLKSNADIDGKLPIEIIQQALRQLHDEFDFTRTLLCLPSGASSLVAVAGVGNNASQIVTKFRCQGNKPDIFRLIMGKKVDLYVADVHSQSYAQYIPEWYGEAVGARSFLLMSLVHEGQFLGMLYGDFPDTRTDTPIRLAQVQVRDLRNHLTRTLYANAKR